MIKAVLLHLQQVLNSCNANQRLGLEKTGLLKTNCIARGRKTDSDLVEDEALTSVALRSVHGSVHGSEARETLHPHRGQGATLGQAGIEVHCD
jgi:hypothetical protein